METNFFKFQVFLFGDFDEVEANPENISFFMSKFLPHNFIPKQVQEVSLNIKGKNPEDFEKDFINSLDVIFEEVKVERSEEFTVHEKINEIDVVAEEVKEEEKEKKEDN